MQRPGFGDRRASITPNGKLVGRKPSLKVSEIVNQSQKNK